jgi:hypothetical protein
MTDIVERLRWVDETSVEECFLMSYLFTAAADEIERLREALQECTAERERLESELAKASPMTREGLEAASRQADKAMERLNAKFPQPKEDKDD